MRKINAFCIKRKKLIIRNPPKIKKKDNTLEIQVYKERNKDNYYIKIPIEKDDIIVTNNRFKMFLRSKIKHPNKQRIHDEKL